MMNVQSPHNYLSCASFKAKIPRPANAFMIYANENRKEMSRKFPRESNKDISKRLGLMWKSLQVSEKARYYELAKAVGEAHKKKYPDYVYNPKEARIRKAMRESSRDQTVGAAPTPSPRGGRRTQAWLNGPEEHLMMTPPPPDLSSQMCGNPIFPGHPSSVGQFIPPMNAYTKLVHVLPSSGWLPDSPTYIQHNPMAELQHHQAHMWHQYQDSLKPCADPSYMLHSHPPPFQETNGNDLQSHKKCKSQTDEFLATEVIDENRAKREKIERKVDSAFLPAEETVVVQNPFEGDDEVKLKKENFAGELEIKTQKDAQTHKNCEGCKHEQPRNNAFLCHNAYCFGIRLDNSNLVYTDVGVIPMYYNDSNVDELLHNVNGTYCLK